MSKTASKEGKLSYYLAKRKVWIENMGDTDAFMEQHPLLYHRNNIVRLTAEKILPILAVIVFLLGAMISQASGSVGGMWVATAIVISILLLVAAESLKYRLYLWKDARDMPTFTPQELQKHREGERKRVGYGQK